MAHTDQPALRARPPTPVAPLLHLPLTRLCCLKLARVRTLTRRGASDCLAPFALDWGDDVVSTAPPVRVVPGVGPGSRVERQRRREVSGGDLEPMGVVRGRERGCAAHAVGMALCRKTERSGSVKSANGSDRTA